MKLSIPFLFKLSTLKQMEKMEKNSRALMSTAYLAPIQYFTKFLFYDEIWMEQEENYQKQSYRNRCNILSSNGVLPLSIPVNKDQPKTKTKDIRIDNTWEWQKIHWTSIESAYSSSPFFEFFQDELYRFYKKEFTFLLDFNMEIQHYMLEQLNIQPVIKLTDKYVHETASDMDDYRDTIHPKERMQKKDTFFLPSFYYQVFQDRFGFVKNLSIIDLLFNEGANAENILHKSIPSSSFNRHEAGK